MKVVLAGRQRDAQGRPNGMQQLFTADGDGKNLTRISPLGDNVYYDWPVWALHGTKIIFAARPTFEDLGLQSIYMSNPDGTDVRTLVVSDWSSGQPKLSPDEQSLLFTSFWPQFPGAALYVLSLNTGQVENLTAQTPQAVHEADGRWSPDGRAILYAGQGDDINGLRPNQVFAINADGGGRQRITNDRWFNVDPMLSPDGRHLVYSSFRGEGHPAGIVPGQVLAPDIKLSTLRVHLDQWQLISLDVATGAQVALTQGMNCLARGRWEPCEPNEGPAWVPIWLPDGQHLAYISARSALDTGVYVMGADGSGARPLVETRNLIVNWHDWTQVDGSAPARATVAPPTLPQTLLYGGIVHEPDLNSGADIATRELIVSTPDLWTGHRLQPIDSSGHALEPDMARWTPDKTHILFTAPVSVAASAAPDATATDIAGQSGYTPPAQLDQVFLMNADASQVRQLTGPTTDDELEPLSEGEVRANVNPDMSPDGRYVIFSSRPLSGMSSLLRLDLTTGEVVNLTLMSSGILPAADLQARFSPDGKRIAFATVLDKSQIFVMSADGRDVQAVTNNQNDNTEPSWSADGLWLVFVSHQTGPTTDIPTPVVPNASVGVEDALTKINVETGETVTLARTRGQVSQPIFSPDGKSVVSIVIPSVDGGVDAFFQPDIYRVSANGGALRPVAVTLRTHEAFVDWR
jgi:Tol biopolymer transport system component